jgi:hypothetical protein
MFPPLCGTFGPPFISATLLRNGGKRNKVEVKWCLNLCALRVILILSVLVLALSGSTPTILRLWAFQPTSENGRQKIMLGLIVWAALQTGDGT